MERREPFGELRAENREGRHAAKRGKMARAGIVAYERAGTVGQRNQLRDVDGRRHVLFAGAQPPAALVGVAGDPHLKIFLPQMFRELFVFFQRPDADGLPCAGVDQNTFMAARGGNRDFFARRQFDVQYAGDDAPIFVAVRLRMRTRERLRQENPAVDAREADAVFGAEDFQEQMVARIPSRGEAKVEVFLRQPVSQSGHFQKRPVPDVIFVFEGGPRRDKGFHAHARPEARLQINGEGLGEKRDVEFFDSGAEERCGDDEVAQSPQFNDEQFGFQAGVFATACGNLDRLQHPPHRGLCFKFGNFRGGFCGLTADAAVECDA